MSTEAWLWAVALAAVAGALGFRAGWRRGMSASALLMWRCGVRAVSDGTLTFADGTTRTERAEP